MFDLGPLVEFLHVDQTAKRIHCLLLLFGDGPRFFQSPSRPLKVGFDLQGLMKMSLSLLNVAHLDIQIREILNRFHHLGVVLHGLFVSRHRQMRLVEPLLSNAQVVVSRGILAISRNRLTQCLHCSLILSHAVLNRPQIDQRVDPAWIVQSGLLKTCRRLRVVFPGKIDRGEGFKCRHMPLILFKSQLKHRLSFVNFLGLEQ